MTYSTQPWTQEKRTFPDFRSFFAVKCLESAAKYLKMSVFPFLDHFGKKQRYRTFRLAKQTPLCRRRRIPSSPRKFYIPLLKKWYQGDPLVISFLSYLFPRGVSRKPKNGGKLDAITRRDLYARGLFQRIRPGLPETRNLFRVTCVQPLRG